MRSTEAPSSRPPADAPRAGFRRRAAAALLVAAATAVACGREPRRAGKTELARLPESAGAIAIADDAGSYAYVEMGDRSGWMVHDGVAGAKFLGVGGPAFAPGTHRLYYWAASNVPDRGFLVVDEKPIGAGDFERESTVVFADGGKRWATAVATADRHVGLVTEPGPVAVLEDGRELGRYPDASLPTFTHDGRHLAYLVSADQGTKLLVDGTERAAYAAPTGECSGRAKARPRASNPNYWPQFQVEYLSDGRLVVMTQDADGWGIYRDGDRIASYTASIVQAQPYLTSNCAGLTAVAAWSLRVAEKAPMAVWWERLPGADERWRVVADGKPVDDTTCVKAWERQPPELSPDGRHLAYACAVAQPEERVFLIADGRRYGGYWDVWAYAWSDDGAHLGYAVVEEPTDRTWRYYVDGSARTGPLSRVWRPRVEAGTGRLAWEGKREDEDRGMVAVDDHRLASFDDVVAGPSFLRPGMVTWVIRRGRRLVRLDVPTR